jgi:DNA transposition AAA+ family ATPase
MQQPALAVNDLAPLVNVGLMYSATQRAMDRSRHLPGMIGFYGPAGWGKTCAAAFVANSLDAHHIQLLSFWNRKEFFTQLCLELGVDPKKDPITGKIIKPSIASMGAQICERLGMTQRPLLIDEADIAIHNGYIDDIRAIYEGSKTTVVMIGEETLPDALLRWERIHSRVLEWVPAQPPDVQDAQVLALKFARDGILIAEDMVARLHQKSGASIRRICVNIERVQEYARENGLSVVDCAAWGNRELYTGAPPPRSAGVQPAKNGRR